MISFGHSKCATLWCISHQDVKWSVLGYEILLITQDSIGSSAKLEQRFNHRAVGWSRLCSEKQLWFFSLILKSFMVEWLCFKRNAYLHSSFYSSAVCTSKAYLQWLASVPLCLRWLHNMSVGRVSHVTQDNIIRNIFYFLGSSRKPSCCDPFRQVPAQQCCQPPDTRNFGLCPRQKPLCEQTWNCCSSEVFAVSRSHLSSGSLWAYQCLNRCNVTTMFPNELTLHLSEGDTNMVTIWSV